MYSRLHLGFFCKLYYTWFEINFKRNFKGLNSPPTSNARFSVNFMVSIDITENFIPNYFNLMLIHSFVVPRRSFPLGIYSFSWFQNYFLTFQDLLVVRLRTLYIFWKFLICINVFQPKRLPLYHRSHVFKLHKTLWCQPEAEKIQLKPISQALQWAFSPWCTVHCIVSSRLLKYMVESFKSSRTLSSLLKHWVSTKSVILVSFRVFPDVM